MAYGVGQTQGLLLFKLTHTQNFAISTLKVREIVPYKQCTTIPGSDPKILGAASIRNVTLPIVDLAQAVGYRKMAPEEYETGYIIITDTHKKQVGYLVRGIDKIIECQSKDIVAPSNSLGKKIYLNGVTTIDNRLTQILDLEVLQDQLFERNVNKAKIDVTEEEVALLNKLNIVMVDDSIVARKQLAQALDSINVNYQLTENADQALAIIKSAAKSHNPVDILVSDIEMPGLNGYELAFAVRDDKHTACAYIILHSSLSLTISRSQASQVGANEALEKFDANTLVQAILRGAKNANPSSTFSPQSTQPKARKISLPTI